jgi:type I restriction enzyme S subunit
VTTLKRYPAYKDSGIDWLGEIPEHWDAGNIRRFAQMRTGHTPSRSRDEYWQDCYIPWFTLADVWQLRQGQTFLGETNGLISRIGLENSAAELLPAGTVVLSRTASVGFSGIMPRPMATSQDFWNWVCGPRLQPKFLWYQFLAMRPHFGFLVQGSTHKTIYQADAAALSIAAPEVKEQDALVDYLDRETAEIDAFIADQEQLIDLLIERHAATIRHAVTSGLDPTVPMKDSGVEWLGKVPAHWSVTRVSRFFSVVLGKMLDVGKTPSSNATVLPYVRAANIQEVGLDLNSVNEMPFSPTEARILDIRRGDLLVVEGGAVGLNTHIDADMTGWSFQKTVNRVRAISDGSTRFLGFSLDALRRDGVIDMLSNKSTIAHLTAEKLERVVIAFPPASEQIEIAEHLHGAAMEIDAAIVDAGQAIALSRERRAALISAAVTGKIDVRDAA